MVRYEIISVDYDQKKKKETRTEKKILECIPHVRHLFFVQLLFWLYIYVFMYVLVLW